MKIIIALALTELATLAFYLPLCIVAGREDRRGDWRNGE